MSRRALLVASVLLAGCTSDSEPPSGDFADPVAVSKRLSSTLIELAAMGEKRAGTPAGDEAAEYVAQRFEEAGLDDIHFEEFSFLAWTRMSSSLSVTVDAAPLAMLHDVFAYSGSGQIDGELVDVGFGHAGDYAGKDVTGKIVVVTRQASFHRSAQYRVVVEQGGAAMLYVSQSPENLIQIGTVADPEDGSGPIPSVTVGADDGAAIIDALAAGKSVSASMAVDATLTPSTGRNVVGSLRGSSDEYIVLGAHFDTWYAGAADNGTGTALLIELAAALASRPDRHYSLVFVGYDGEELGLFGGYDYLRDHVVVDEEPMVAFVNFEMPAAGAIGLRALAHTDGGPVDAALSGADLDGLYTSYVSMEIVPALFGGIIPTDIQGMYWSGLQGTTTACDSPYYHTTEDTPDKVDIPFLADATIGFARALTTLDDAEAPSFAVHDPAVWKIDATVADVSGGLEVSVAVRDAMDTPQPNAVVRVWLDVDDFTRAHDETVSGDAAGEAQVVIPTAALAMGSGARWIHVTAGEGFPRAERIVPLP